MCQTLTIHFPEPPLVADERPGAATQQPRGDVAAVDAGDAHACRPPPDVVAGEALPS